MPRYRGQLLGIRIGGEAASTAPQFLMPGPLRFRRLQRVEILGLEVPIANTLSSRLLGLALLSRERAGPGLAIPRCRSVHTFGMRFPVDVLFLDPALRVVEIRRSVPPGRIVRCTAATAVLELPSPRVGGGEPPGGSA